MRELRDIVARTWAFARKEVADIVRQPQLLVTLILGPFLILAVFGMGYQQETDALRTVFVVAENSEFSEELQARAQDLGEDMEFLGTVATEAEAERWLRSGDADVAVVVPEAPVETIRSGERATFTVMHDRLDPFEQATIWLMARGTVDLVNRQLLEELVAAGQAESADIETLLPAAADSAQAMRIALESGNTSEAAEQRTVLASQIDQIRLRTTSTEVLIDNIEDEFEARGADDSLLDRIDELSGAIDGIATSPGSDLDREAEEARVLEEDLETLNQQLEEFQEFPPEVLVSPFGAEAEVVGATDPDITSFYAPAVIALLIQHIGITFGGLSLVRERALGTPEIFKVSPTHPAQILAGKYLGYLGVIALAGLALSGLMLFVFGVPLEGSGGDYVAVLALLALASLGVGFVISSVVDSDTQAVNLSLIALLLSIFFSGFFLSLERLSDAVRGVSWALPITHAIDSLRDVMFRGEAIEPRTLLALGLASIVLFGVALAMTGRRMRAA